MEGVVIGRQVDSYSQGATIEYDGCGCYGNRGKSGTVLTVDKSASRECIGRFFRVRIRLNLREPLMRWMMATFPDEGRVWVQFKYEGLPNYYFYFGKLGHVSRVCKVHGMHDMHGMRVGDEPRRQGCSFLMKDWRLKRICRAM